VKRGLNIVDQASRSSVAAYSVGMGVGDGHAEPPNVRYSGVGRGAVL
jgi:hypothetical protein